MRRLGLLFGAAFLFVRLGSVARDRFTRVAVSGHSMEPTLHDGDWLIVDRRGVVDPGSLVVARDPRAVGRLIVKRVKEVGTQSEVVLESDHPAHADELIGVLQADLIGSVVAIYWPPSRVGSSSSQALGAAHTST